LGPVLIVSLGGVWTEALGDTRVLPPYLTPDRGGARLLSGFRGARRPLT
jgi:hypothetical protein